MPLIKYRPNVSYKKMLQHYFYQTKKLGLAQQTYHTHSRPLTDTSSFFFVCVRLTAQDMGSLTVTSLRNLVRKSDISKSFHQMAHSNPVDSNVSLQSPKSTALMTSVILSCTGAIWHNGLFILGYKWFERRLLTETKSLRLSPP
jgi:hypothetical protein